MLITDAKFSEWRFLTKSLLPGMLSSAGNAAIFVFTKMANSDALK